VPSAIFRNAASSDVRPESICMKLLLSVVIESLAPLPIKCLPLLLSSEISSDDTNRRGVVGTAVVEVGVEHAKNLWMIALRVDEHSPTRNRTQFFRSTHVLPSDCRRDTLRL